MRFLRNMFGSKRSQTEELIDALIQCRSASVRSDSLKPDTRSATAVAATDTPVPMFDFERFEVVDEILVASGGSFPERMPLLDTHDRSSVFKVFGSAINARRESGEWLLDMEFDDDDESQRAFRKVKNQHVRDVSIGYEVLQREYVEAGRTKIIGGVSYTAGDRTLKVSTAWRGQELSLAPIGADRQAKIRALLSRSKPVENTKRADVFAAEVASLIVDSELELDEVVADLSEAIDGDVESILSGETAPSEEQVETIAAVLDADASELLEMV